jgi:hypothetical protein
VLNTDLVPADAPSLGESISADGYVRMTPVRLRAIGFVHLLSGLDMEPVIDLGAAGGATPAVIAGFTEWASPTSPALSLGWDWAAEVQGKGLRYCRTGEPRSNIMLLNPLGRDFGFEQNTFALGLAVDELTWQDTVAAYVLARYS